MRAKLLVALLIVPHVTGCTAIGYGIGAAIPKHETIDARTFVEANPRPGKEIQIGDFHGRFVSAAPGSIAVESDGATSSVAVSPDTPVTIEKGDHAHEGLIVGALVDVTATIALVTGFVVLVVEVAHSRYVFNFGGVI